MKENKKKYITYGTMESVIKGMETPIEELEKSIEKALEIIKILKEQSGNKQEVKSKDEETYSSYSKFLIENFEYYEDFDKWVRKHSSMVDCCLSLSKKLKVTMISPSKLTELAKKILSKAPEPEIEVI